MRIKDIAPIILTAVSAVSSVGAVIMAIHETPRAIQILDDHRLEIDPDFECEEDPLTTSEKIKDYAKGYWKTGILLGLSVGSGIAGCVIGHMNYKSLAATTALVSAAYSKHKDKVKKFVGEEKAKLIDQAVKDEIDAEKAKNPTELVWFQDSITEQFFQMTWDEYRQRQIYAIQCLCDENEGQVSLGEVFPPLKKLAPVGSKAIWDAHDNLEHGGWRWVDFKEEKRNSRASEDDCPIDIRFNEGRETWVISYSVYPIPYKVALDGGYFSPQD